jgi:CHAT domain-containing protein
MLSASPTMCSHNVRYSVRSLIAVAGVLLAAISSTVRSQEVPADAIPDVPLPASRPISMTEVEARAVLATPVVENAPLQERIDLLARQRAAARILGEQAALVRALEQLAELGKGRPDWTIWMMDLMNTQFTFGGQQRGLEVGEKLLAESSLDPLLRANAAANLAWKYCEVSDLRNCERVYGLAQRSYAELPTTVNTTARDYALVQNLMAKGQVMRVRGDTDARVAALREATIAVRNYVQAVAATTGGDTLNASYRGALNIADYTGGQLVYALIAQGRAAEALAVAQDGLARARLANLGPDSLGAWHHRLAAAYIAQRRFEDALGSARVSVAELARSGGQANGLMFALARNAEVVSLVALERWKEADETYTAFLNEIRADKVAYDRSYAAPLVALLAAKNGRAEVGLKVIDNSYRYRQRTYGPKHPMTTEARAVRGAIYLISDSPATAMADYDDFFTAILDTSSGWLDLAPIGFRGQYFDIVMAEFLRYAAKQYQGGGPSAVDRRVFERLVQVTDRLGSGVAQRSILESSAKVRTGDPALADMLSQEQDLRGKLRTAYGQIFADVLASDAKDTPEDKRKLLREQLKVHRDAAEAAQKQLEAVRSQLVAKFPDFLALVNPVNPSLDTIQNALTGGEAFVGIYPTREGTFVWAVNANGQRALHISKWTDADAANRVAAMRTTLDVGDRLPKLPAMNFAPALEMYNELLRPVRPALAGATVLNVSAAGALGALPLAALVTGPAQDPKTAPWLVRDFAIAQTPGAAAFVTLRKVEARALAPKALIGFGDPQFRTVSSKSAATSPHRARNLVVTANAAQASTYSVENGFRYANIPALPETRDELIALATALGADPQGDLLLGPAATRKAVMTTPLADRRVVAFATHGLLPGDIPGLSKPALAMAATNDPDESPLLSLDDVLSLKLNSQWVVLSACNTAGGERDGTAMSGLVRGFFFAGTRSVLATHWAVESEASRQLVGLVFQDFAKDPKGGRAASLRRAQLAMIDGTLGGGDYAHPFYWAPYALFGDPVR